MIIDKLPLLVFQSILAAGQKQDITNKKGFMIGLPRSMAFKVYAILDSLTVPLSLTIYICMRNIEAASFALILPASLTLGYTPILSGELFSKQFFRQRSHKVRVPTVHIRLPWLDCTSTVGG
jgi:hypothetical protein